MAGPAPLPTAGSAQHYGNAAHTQQHMQPSITANAPRQTQAGIGPNAHTGINQEAAPDSEQQVGPSSSHPVAANAAAQPSRQTNSPASGDVNQRMRREPDASGSYRQAGHRRKPVRQSQPAAAVVPPQAGPPQAAEPETLGRGRRAKTMTAAAKESAEQADLDKALLVSRKTSHQHAAARCAVEPTGHPTGSKRRQRDGEQQLPQPKKGRFAAGIVGASSSRQRDVSGTAQLLQHKHGRFAVAAARSSQPPRAGARASKATRQDDSPAVVPSTVLPLAAFCRYRKRLHANGIINCGSNKQQQSVANEGNISKFNHSHKLHQHAVTGNKATTVADPTCSWMGWCICITSAATMFKRTDRSECLLQQRFGSKCLWQIYLFVTGDTAVQSVA